MHPSHSAHVKMPLLGLSLRFSYSHLLFSPTLALPVDGVGVPGAALDKLSPNRLLLIGLPPPWLNRLVADPFSAFWNSGLPVLVLGEKGEFEVDMPKLPRGLPDKGDCEPWSWLKLLLRRGVDRW
jgi:hypothetical protein